MSNKDLVSELKAHIKELTAEKDTLNRTVTLKDSRIKQLLIKIEDANEEVKAIAKRMEEHKNEAEEAKEEVEKVKKKIKQIKHNLSGGMLDDQEDNGVEEQTDETHPHI
jgi:chromosome segregation ATPase